MMGIVCTICGSLTLPCKCYAACRDFTHFDQPTLKQIAEAIYKSAPHYIASMNDCIKAAEEVQKLYAK